MFLGAFFELLLSIANIGTALALYPILKRQNEALALGYVAARVVEWAFIAVGIVSVLSIVTLRQDAADADADSPILYDPRHAGVDEGSLSPVAPAR